MAYHSRPKTYVDSPIHYMTQTEIDIMNYIGGLQGDGLDSAPLPTIREIADHLNMSYSSVNFHTRNLLERGYLTADKTENGNYRPRTLKLKT